MHERSWSRKVTVFFSTTKKTEMLRPATVKGVVQLKENDALRGPEHVERVWDEAVDGAWAPGKAPVTLLSEFLRHVQDEDVEKAEVTAREILAVEPQNQLVQDLVAAMKQQQELEEQFESEDESEQEEEDDDDDDDEESEDEEGSVDAPEHEREDK